MANNLILRGNTWHARLVIPTHLRSAFNRREFTQSLKTSSKTIAAKLANDKVALWRLQLDAAAGDANAVEVLAAELAVRVKEEESKGQYADTNTGVTNSSAFAEHYADGLSETDRQRFYSILTGRRTLPLNTWALEWADKVYSNTKTNQIAVNEIRNFCVYAPSVSDVTKNNIRRWLKAETRSRKTIERALSFARKYWTYLQDVGVVSDDAYPFVGVKLPDTLKAPERKREPFDEVDIPILFEALQVDRSVYLASLVALHSGARLAEILGLTKSDIVHFENHTCFHIAGTKTEASNRYVPIHSALQPIIDLLLDESDEQWLIPHVRSKGGAYRRGDVLGKRFGRLKTKLNFPSTKVFHSLRKTFITACEQAEAPEGVVADIVGHEKQTMTYGLYSGGSSIPQRAKVMASLDFGLTISPIGLLKTEE